MEKTYIKKLINLLLDDENLDILIHDGEIVGFAKNHLKATLKEKPQYYISHIVECDVSGGQIRLIVQICSNRDNSVGRPLETEIWGLNYTKWVGNVSEPAQVEATHVEAVCYGGERASQQSILITAQDDEGYSYEKQIEVDPYTGLWQDGVGHNSGWDRL